MTPKADKFISDVRLAARLEQKPFVVTNAQLFGPSVVARALERAAIWLTPKVVDSYDPAEFQDLAREQREELNTAVDAFRSIASSIPSDQPATESQFRDGLQTFNRLKSAIQKVVMVDWESAANSLIQQVEGWARDLGWNTRREAKDLTETLIGSYRLDRLYLHAEGNLYVLEPLARFVAGGSGGFVLSLQLSSNSTGIYRHSDGVWRVHLQADGDPEVTEGDRLSKESFCAALRELRSPR